MYFALAGPGVSILLKYNYIQDILSLHPAPEGIKIINNKGELYIRARQTTEDKIPVMPRGFSHTGSDTAP